MTMSKSKRHRFALIGLAVILAASPVGGIGDQEAQAVLGSQAPIAKQYTVTLLTGDVVTVVTRQSGCPLISVKPAKPSGIQLRSCDVHGHARVIPAEVAPLIGSVLDEALFDVTTLIQEGYDDASTKELPLIVHGQAALAARPGSRALSSIGATAVKHAKGSGLGFLQGVQPPSRSATSAGPLVRLDRRVRVTRWQGQLERNIKQVSAPQAWAGGFTGRGVKVAVLDTGADFAHPDLVGQVAERADFTVEGGTATDGHGHGTHVAAVIAGTGAAAAGERRGIAPDARLVVGKVLDDGGFGSESQVIAGMEWAAARAKVVNMSFGGWEPSDGTDPMSLAVNELTAKHGTLFVIASGNEGVDNYITSPAAAADALTVGAVDGDDKVAWFSSRGPLINTRAAKPELVAPGVEIVAARAAGTSMGRVIDSRYTAASGTSMAAPHAAAGAAILAQRYPRWTPAQLKAALVGAVDPLPSADTYVSGSGRLNVARALNGAVSGQPIVHLGTFAHPPAGVAQTELSWVNAPGGLRFEVSTTDRGGSPAPAGAVSFDGRTLSVDRARFAGRAGSFTTVVTARTAWGTTVSVTPVTFYAEPAMVDLTLSATAPPHTPPVGGTAFGYAQIVNLDDPAIFADGTNVDPGAEPVVLRVPAGRYSVMATFLDFDTGTATMVGDPDIAVSTDTSLLLDAARAKPVSATVEGVPTVANQKGLTFEQTARRGDLWFDWAFAWGADAQRDSVFAGPVSGVGVGSFEFFSSFSLLAPGDEPSPYAYDVIEAHGNGIPENVTVTVDRAEQARMSRLDQKFHVLDMPGGVTTHKRYGVSPSGLFVLESISDNVPAHRVDYLTPGYRYVDEAFHNVGLDGFASIESRRMHEAGSREEKVWVRQPLRPDWYDDPRESTSGCMPQPIRRTRQQLRVELVEVADQHQRFGCFGLGSRASRSLTLHRDGQLVGEVTGTAAQFDIPAAAATYRLAFDLEASAVLPVSTRVTTAWTFRSAGPKSTGDVPVALLSVDYALALDAANRPAEGRAAFTLRQAHGVAPQRITSFTLFTSLDDGATWQPVTVRRDSVDTFSALLPRPGEGRAVSLRVKADGSAGSAIEQTIIRAYR